MSSVFDSVRVPPQRTGPVSCKGAPIPRLRILLVGLYTERYPAVGETHGLSVVAASLQEAYRDSLEELCIIDLVAVGRECLTPVLTAIESFQPNVVGLSVPYGTYSTLLQLTPHIRELLDRDVCVLLGGAIPTYLSGRILVEIDPRVVVVVGEGEEASVGAVAAWAGKLEWTAVPNLHFATGDALVMTTRSLVDLTKVPIPYRAHMPGIVASGAQVFVESSRGCSWASCSFCLRGLTDIAGASCEFRRFGKERLTGDFQSLCDLGVTAVTFADEDFLAGLLGEMEAFSDALEGAVHAIEPKRLAFDASVTIKSIYDKGDTASDRARREDVLRRLVSLGLRKLFLGIESGSASQLRRYKKGHTPEECLAASKQILASGAKLELGFIMFDPLCSRAEIVENVRFLLDNDLAQYASSPTSELRMQIGTSYLQSVQKVESELGIELYDRELDTNTLSYRYRFLDPSVSELARTVRQENAQHRPLVYRLKGLTRFGDGRILGPCTDDVAGLLGRYRTQMLEALVNAAQIPCFGYEREAKRIFRELATGVLRVGGLFDHSTSLITETIGLAHEVFESY